MADAGLVLRIIAILLALAGYVSFTWAVVSLFRRAGPTPAAMRWLGFFGTVFFTLQVVALLFRTPPVGAAVVGLTLYAASLAIFWWAVPFARQAQLGLAFTGAKSSVLMQDGPYRWVRHPFYSAYLLFWFAGVAATGEPWLLVSVVVMGSFYLSAIRREEGELLSRSDFPGYAEYRERTGCLVPRW